MRSIIRITNTFDKNGGDDDDDFDGTTTIEFD